jgi:putative DNA primase/helicase
MNIDANTITPMSDDEMPPDDNGNVDSDAPPGAPGWLSDANISKLLVNRVLRGKYCWAKGLGGWMRCDGKKWVPTTDQDVIEQSRLFATELVAEAVRTTTGTTKADLERIGAYTRRLTAGAVRAAADLAKGQLLVDAADFDRRPDLLNVANGVVDLRTGTLGPHDPALLFTKCAPTEYHPDARHVDWDTALTALPDDVAEWVQLRLGQAITGHPVPDDVLCVFQGGGSNGKTTLTTGINRTLGEGQFAVTVPERVLLASPGDHPTELMTLRGARLALLEETPEARHLNVKRLKDVLGTTTMTARLIAKDSVTWPPTHSLFLSTNYRPRVDETDHGTWRRLALVTFPKTYRRDGGALEGENDRRGDPTLRQRIDAGLDCQHRAILRWLVDGAKRWYAAGRVMTAPPKTVVDDTLEWRYQTDLALRFFDDKLIAAADYYILGSELYEVFTEWLGEQGNQKWGAQTFAERFGQHDEVVGARIRHDRIWLPKTPPKTAPKTLLTASRRKPPFAPFGDPPALPTRFRAWIGVRLRDDDDDYQEFLDQGKRDLWT